MLVDGAAKFIAELHRLFKSADSYDAILKTSATVLAKELGGDLIQVTFVKNSERYSQSWGERGDESVLPVVCQDENILFGGKPIHESIFINDINLSRAPLSLLQVLEERQTQSFALVLIRSATKIFGWIEVHFRTNFHRFRKEEIFLLDIVAEYSRMYLEQHQNALSSNKATVQEEPTGAQDLNDELYRDRLLEARLQYRRLLEYGNIIIVRTNASGVVTDVVGDTESIFGVTAGELVSDLGVWERFVPPTDLRILMKLVRAGETKQTDLKEEIRVINKKTGEVKRLLIRGVPLYASDEKFIGWEGFAVDISDKHSIQVALQSEQKRLAALYDISQSLTVSMEPSMLLLTGIRALMKASSAECALCILLDEASGCLDIAATEGFSSGDVIEFQHRLPRESIYRSVITQNKGIIVSGDTALDGDRVQPTTLAYMRAALIVPLNSEDGTRGVIALFARRASRFTAQDLEVADVGAKQIASVLRQSEFFATERKTSDALAFLYRLSHVLAQYLTPKDIAENAFPIIQEEIPCKRMWFGVLNDQGTVIAGQSAIGPGMRSSIARIQIELDLRHDFLDEALKNRQPIVVKQGDKIECSGLNRIFERLQPATLCLVPLVALGQVIGLLVLEPVVSSPTYAQRKLPLLTSLGNELGSLVLARRFESRIADAEKMRMASMFANGVAHNFNNLLQAIMGQASLIELQAGAGSPFTKAARIINESATRGASLVQQLKSFSTNANLQKKTFLAESFLENSIELYRSMLGENIELVSTIEPGLRSIYGDEGQIQRALSNIIVNAKEALEKKGSLKSARIILHASAIRLGSGEVHPELAPGLYVAIKIHDNGPGIDSDKLVRIFEPFFTTKSVDQSTGLGLSGSGLGLSSAYSIIKQHDGIITVTSALNQGAAFTIYLPLTREVASVTSIQPDSVKDSSSSHQDTVNSQIRVIFIGIDSLTSNAITSGLYADGVKTESLLDSSNLQARAAALYKDNSVVFVFDAEKEESKLLGFIRSLRDQYPRSKFIISCVDSQRWSSMVAMIGEVSDLEVIEKSLGVWSLQSTVKRLLGLRRTAPKIEPVSV
jgi:PAS domain S-box-containing protein